LGALGAVLAHATLVTVVERHAAIHPTALPLVDLFAAGGAFHYVRWVWASYDDLVVYLGFAHLVLFWIH
jgi:hypothetical protein